MEENEPSSFLDTPRGNSDETGENTNRISENTIEIGENSNEIGEITNEAGENINEISENSNEQNATEEAPPLDCPQGTPTETPSNPVEVDNGNSSPSKSETPPVKSPWSRDKYNATAADPACRLKHIWTSFVTCEPNSYTRSCWFENVIHEMLRQLDEGISGDIILASFSTSSHVVSLLGSEFLADMHRVCSVSTEDDFGNLRRYLLQGRGTKCLAVLYALGVLGKLSRTSVTSRSSHVQFSTETLTKSSHPSVAQVTAVPPPSTLNAESTSSENEDSGGTGVPVKSQTLQVTYNALISSTSPTSFILEKNLKKVEEREELKSGVGVGGFE
ncbi:hypothetical protein WDU94_003401 [Cyamophila willieti]